MAGENCASTCKTRDHDSFGECCRAKNVQVGDLMNTGIQRAGRKNLDEYARARKYGIQPKSTRPKDVQHAVRESERTGEAFQA